MRVLVSGASGFVGREVVQELASNSSSLVVAASRGPLAQVSDNLQKSNVDFRTFPDLEIDSGDESFDRALEGVDVVVHLAAKTPSSISAVEQLNAVNALSMERLVRFCAKAGVSRFVFLSSLGVSGSITRGQALSESSPNQPHDAYSASKVRAEQLLQEAAVRHSIETTIIRAPMVYGPGTKGPIALLSRGILKGWPLPLGAVSFNKRDMIGVSNLASFVAKCASLRAAAGETFVVRDGETLSTRRLVELIAAAAGRSARLVYVPLWTINASAKVLGKRHITEKLTGDYQVDDQKARRLLNWEARHPVAYDIGRMVQGLKGSI